MKRIISTVVYAVMILNLFAGKGLIVTQKYSEANAPGSSVSVTWYVTETRCKMKMEFSDAKVNTLTWFIPDIKSNSLLTYAEGPVPVGVQKSFFSIPVQEISRGNNGNASAVSVKRTGEAKTVFGMVCEKVVFRSSKGITEMWVTKEFQPDFYKFYPFYRNSFELMALSEEKIKGFPVESVTKDEVGNVISSYKLIAAAISEINDSDFLIPAEYKSVSDMTKGKN